MFLSRAADTLWPSPLRGTGRLAASACTSSLGSTTSPSTGRAVSGSLRRAAQQKDPVHHERGVPDLPGP
jgi:hypothetical protein